jgi:hypothetical protein
MLRGKQLGCWILAISFSILLADAAMAQPGGRGGRGGGWGGNSATGLMSSEAVQKELDIVDDQMERVREIQKEQGEAFRNMFSGMRDKIREMDDEERQQAFGEIREKMQASNEEFNKKVHDVLLPEQVQRLKQIQAQMENQRGGLGSVSDSLTKELGITDEQKSAMKEKADQVRKDLTEKLTKLRQQAQDEILSVLDPEQQKKYREMMGTPFDLESMRGGQGGRGGRGGGGRGGPGGRGGDRGGERDQEDGSF